MPFLANSIVWPSRKASSTPRSAPRMLSYCSGYGRALVSLLVLSRAKVALRSSVGLKPVERTTTSTGALGLLRFGRDSLIRHSADSDNAPVDSLALRPTTLAPGANAMISASVTRSHGLGHDFGSTDTLANFGPLTAGNGFGIFSVLLTSPLRGPVPPVAAM